MCARSYYRWLAVIVCVLVHFNLILKTDASENTVTYSEGQNISIQCNVTEVKGVKVWWTKNDNTSDFREDGVDLIFHSVNRSDTGSYLCYVEKDTTGSNATVMDTVMLNILYPGEATYFALSTNKTIENQTVVINAGVIGNPDPVYRVVNIDANRQWLAADINANFSLNITAQCEDQGTYMVTGYNKLNKNNFTRSEYLTVLCSPRPTGTDNEIIVYSELGDSAQFLVRYLGNPQPTLMWTRNGIDVSDLMFVNRTDLTGIRIMNLTLDDFGLYFLRMTNNIGTNVVPCKVIARGPPGKATRLNITDISETRATMHWYTGYDYGEPATCYLMLWQGNSSGVMQTFDEVNPSPPSGQQWVTRGITNLNRNQVYRVGIQCQNKYGRGDMSDYITFRTLGESSPSNNLMKLAYIIPASLVGTVVLVVIISILYKRHKNSKYHSIS